MNSTLLCICVQLFLLLLKLPNIFALALRRPPPDKLLECNKPLGMHSGAISRNDISASHWWVTFNTISKGGTNLIKLQPKSHVDNLSFPYFLEIMFRQVTIITGYHLNHVSNSMNFEGHYYGYSYINGNTADFQFILSTRQLLINRIPSNGSVNYRFETPVKARNFRIYFLPTYVFQIKVATMQFEIYVCPHWNYAKPLGMSSGLISKQRIMSYANKQRSNPYLARLDSQGFGWQPLDSAEIQKNIGNAKYWLQIVLPALKKVIYIIVQGSKFDSNLRTNYWIQYGRDENLLTTYKILPPPYGAFLNATHVFSTPLIASIIRYIPVLPRISKPRVKIELYGVDYLTPDHNWKLVLPHSFTDSIQFEDLRPTNRIWPKAAFSYLRRHQKYPHLRTEELPSNDCLINPDFCKDGFTASFGFSDIEKWKLPKSHEAFVISKYYDGTCEQLTLEKNLTINSMFGIHFNSIQLQRFQTVHSLLHMRGYFPNSNLIIQAFVNQNTSYVENCLYGKAPHQYILKGKFKFSSKRIDISNFLQRIGNSKAWKYGTSLSLVIEPTAANYLGVMISSSLSLSIFPACHSHKTNIITQLPNSNFQQQSDTDCHQLPHLVKFSEKGYQSCNHNEIVQINLMKQYLITALKVAGVKQLIHTDLNVTTSFKIEYSRNNIAWETFSLDFERKIIHPEKTEITPLPHPVYMQYLKIIPNKDKYVGTNHGLRFDVITCDNAESQQSGWIKLNSADVCVGVKDESPGRFTLLNNVDISFVKFVHKSGGVACAHGSSQTNFGCGSTMLIFLTDGSNKVILPSLSNNGYEVPPYDPNSPNFQLKLNEPRFFQYGQEFAVWFGEDLFNVTENDNHGSTCLDLYGWGRPYPHRSLMTTKLQTTYLCVTVSSDTLIVDSHCEDSFFMTTEMYLVHANSGKCVMRDCSTNSCEVRVVQECSHEFEIVEGFVKHTQSGQYLVEHNGKVVLASSCDGNCFILTDSVEFLNTEIWEHYFSNNLLMSKKGASNTDDAARKCSQHNSDLLSIHSKEEALAIFNFLRTSDLNYQYMIGLKKIATSNVYSWIDGTPFDKDKFDGMKGNMSATNNPCIIMHDGKLHILECHSRKFICKKKFYSIPEFSVPLLSSGLHSVDNYHEGKGFQVNLAFFHKFYLSATVESDHSSCYASYNLPNKVEYNVNLFGITWSKLKKELKLYLDGKSVISVACIDLSSFHRIVRKPIEPSMSNFINIAGFYDHLASYGSSNYRSILNDVKVWRIYLTDDQFYDDYSSNKITFSEYYRAVDDKSIWKLQNTCGVNKNVPCYDVDMSLAKLTDCVWLDGGPVGDFNLAFNTLDETRCIYKCYLERNKIGSINGVSYANKQCYCVSDMYDINDTMRHQKSCFLPVKVTNGRQTVQKSMKNIKIHPVNKMWYGIGDDSFIYRHPARTSPNVDLWKKVIAMCAVIKFDIFERNIWILCNNHSLYQWFNKDHIVEYNGKYRDIAVGKDFFYGVGKITYSLYYIPYAISKTPTSISNKAILKKLSIDAYNSRCYILTMDGNIKFVSDKDNTKSHDLPAVEDISQIATSIFGNLYINNGRNIKILNNDKYDDVQLTDSNMVSFTAFDVENDEYLIGMNENGVLHQYTISTSEKIVLYANASQTNMTAIHRTNNHSSCDSSLIKVNAMQTAVVFTFAVGIQQDVIINTAFIHLNINEINNLSTSASYKITTLWQSPQDIVGCEHIVAEENHNLVKPVSWSVEVLSNVITTADVSSLIQHAVNHGHWFHGRNLYVIMIPDADNDVNLEFDIRAAYLEVFYANQKPNNYLHIPTSALPYTSFQTDYYLPNHQYLTFWLYMSEKGSAILMVWKIYYWYTHRNTMLCRAKNKDFTKGWKQINVPLYSTSYFKISFQVYHRDRSGYGDVAIDNIHVFKDLNYSGVNKITKDYQSSYDPANYTSYIAVMKTLNLPTPLLLYPLALPEYYLQDYGPHHLHLVDDTIDSKVRVHFPDKYGMWDHCVQLDELDSKLGLFNLDIYSAVVAIKTEWAFLFHFYPLYVDKSIKIVQFGIQGDLISINMKQNRLYIVMQSNAEFIEEVFPLAVNKNKWAYVGVTYSAGRMKLFKNNKLEKEFDLPLTFAIPFPQSIHFFSNDKVHEVFKGYLSCFQLYNKSLTLAEVRALEFCPNRQELFYHDVKCKNGFNLALSEEPCACYDENLRHQTASCENAFAEGIFKDALVYIPFDYETTTQSDKGEFRLTYQSSGNVSLKPGPMDYAACVSNQFSKIGSFATPCSGDFSTCTEKYVIGFWFYVSHQETSIEQSKVFRFGDISMQVTYSSSEATIAAQTNIQWNGEICFFTTLPLNSWIYVNVELSSSNVSIFLNSVRIANSEGCSYPSGSKNDVMVLSIGSNVCIDDFSIFSVPNSYADAEVIYNWYLFGSTTDYRKYVQIKLIIFSQDFYQPANYNTEEKDFIYQSVHLMLQHFFSQYFTKPTIRYIGYKPVQLVKINPTRTTKVGLLVLLSYLPHNIENAFYTIPTQSFAHDGREYLIMRDYDKASTIGVLPTPLKFTATPLNSSTVTLKINNHVEDERYHVGFLVNITSYYLIDSLSIHHHFVKYFKTGRLKLFLFNLSPYKKYEIALWSLTHQGIGPRGKQVLHTPIDVNIIPPQDVGAFNTSHTSIEVEWSMYDNITHWNSENLTIRIYWKKVDFNYNNTQKSFSSYDYADMHSTLRNFSDFSYGDDVITSYEITGLEAFTNYSILVATVNDAGVGAFASMFCRSDQWLPEEAPNILLLELISPGVVFIRWNYTEDIIFNSWEMSGYNLTIEPLYPSLSQSVAFTSLLLYKQDMFNSSVLDYFNLFKVTIFAFNEIGNGPTAQICFATGQEVPNYYLSIVKLINKTHNSINIRFGQVPRENENGIITHYVINYRPTDWKSTFINVIKNLTHTSDEWNYWKQMSNVNVSCSMKQPPNSSKVVDLNFTGLYPFTNYEFNFTPCTMVNCSNMQRTVVFRTAETYPSCAPNFTMSNTSSSSSLFITIGPLGHFCMNGILRFYHVVFLESELYGERIYNLLLNDILKENVENLTVNTHTATGLKKYWNYTAVVYVENSIGNGPHSFKWAVTAQDAPDGPPTNISGYANSSSSITLNVTLPKREHRNGIIRGYKVHLLNLINLTAHEVVFDVIDEPASILVVENLNFFTSYEIKVRAFTKVGDGPYTSDAPFLFSLILKTFEDVPTAPPSNVNVTSVTSDSVTVTWQKVPSDFQNGILNSFQLEISGILANNTLHTLRPPNISFLDYLDDYRSSISALFPYTQYNVSVQGCTTPGCGMKGWLQFTTDEMAPIGKIQFLQQINMDIKESLHFNWSDINPMKKRGEITFFISYNKHEKPWEEYNEFSTTFTVPGNQLSASIYNLNNYTSYRIAIYGIGRKGIGPLVTSDMRTSENVPLYSPQITFANNISSSGINVKFTKLPQSSWQGELLGYHVYYQHADEPTNCTAGQICKNMEFKDCIGDDINTCDVTELDLYTNYSVCIAGYTSAGVGPMSKCVYVITDTFVNGNWTEWSEWGNCDRSCANGTETRLRFCINPIPARGGANCSGLDVSQRLCNDFPCPGFYLAKPLTDCTETCENLGSKFACSDIIDTENTTHVFETSISGYDYTDIQGVTCSPDDSQKTFSKEYDPSFFFNKNICSGYARVPGRIKCSTDGKFSEGIRRLCYCVDIEAMSYTSWAIWSPCSVSCGRGVFRRFRTCLLESGCNKTVDIKDCNTQLCPVDGQWSAWTGFGKCSKSCGLGSNTRNRYCNSPPALFGGKKCEGKDSESIDGCNPNPCPRDGHWSEWSALRPCSRPCGAGGVQVKQRYCNNPEPLYGGDSCNGPDEIQYPCNEDVLCREIGVNFLIKMTNETWHYTIHYDNSVKGRKVRSHLINEVMAVMSNSSVGLSVVSDVVVNEMSRGSVIANFTVFYRVNSFVETLILQNAIDDIGFINTTPVQMLSITSHNVPYNAPKFTATSTVFDKIFVSWENDIDWAIPEQFSMYYVFYRNLTVPNVNWTSLGTVNTTIEITDLKGDTLYGIRLIAGISDANGIASMELKVRTAEGVPNIAPPNFIYQEMSPTSIFLDWDEIPKNKVPGTLLGYKIVYKRLDSNLTRDTTTAANMLQRTLNNLKPASWYLFTIYGYTVAGNGPVSFITFKTAYDAPGVPPPDVSWEDRFSSYRIKITWNPIPAEEENGYVVGYKMEYVLVRQADIDVTVGETLSVKEVDRFTFSAYIDDLSPYSMYKFKIFAFAKEGDGPAFTFTAETCRCPEYIYSNFHSLQPYIYHDRSKGKDIQGFFPQLLTTILKEVCTNCKTYTVPKIYFDRTLTGHSAEKQNAQHMKEDIGSTVQLNMPVYGKFAVRKYAGIYPYIGIVRTQGSAAIMYNQKVRRYQMKDLLRNVFASWTIVAIMVLLSIKFGLLLWFTEQCSSTSNFTLSDCRKGALQGMWMAFVTIGTVGYGDYVPTTRLSKVLTICWTLIGLITTSIFIASISTNLVSSNLQQEVKLYGVEVAVIPGTAEYSLAVARNAKIYNVSRPMDVLEAVNKDIVSIGLLDALTATSYSDYLKKMTLTVKKIFDTSSGYGTVLSGGLESLEDDVRSYFDANQGSISAFINSQTDVLKPNVTILKTELIAKAELVDFSIMLCYVFLAFCAFGISVWLCCLKRNRAKKIQPIASRDVMVKKELTQDINDFAHNFKSRVKKMDEKHFGELSRLQVLRTNFMRLMKRHGHTEKEVNDRFEAIRRKHLKKISKRNRLKYLETNI